MIIYEWDLFVFDLVDVWVEVEVMLVDLGEDGGIEWELWEFWFVDVVVEWIWLFIINCGFGVVIDMMVVVLWFDVFVFDIDDLLV